MNAIKELEREQLRTDVPEIAPGDTVRVSVKVVEGTRERIQVFEGTVMRMRGGGLNKPSPSAVSPAASAWSGPSWSTRRGSRRSRSFATASLVAPSSTSSATGSASPPRSASAAPTDRRAAGAAA